MADLTPEQLQLAMMLMNNQPQGKGGAQFGGNKFGGGLFGGSRFGGNTFGGNKFGASAPQSVNVPATPPQLPPFEQPGGSLPPFNPGAPPPPAGAAPLPRPAPVAPAGMPAAVPPMPDPTQVGAPPMLSNSPPSVPDSVRLAIQQLMQSGKLPEQWGGRFTPGYGEPT